MQFLYPSFLWALAAIAIPVIIHLFYFRRFKKVYFTNVRFLRELKKETSSRSRLRNLLLLLTRILAIAALVFAFAQPFLPLDREVHTGRKLVSVFVDNSFSMSQTDENVPLLDLAREKAREIVQSYSATDKFQMLSNRPSGTELVMLSQDDALRQIGLLELSPGSRKADAVVQTIRELRQRDHSLAPVAYLISDFQQQQFESMELADTAVAWNLVPLRAVRQSNIGIDSAWFEAPVPLAGQPNKLLVRIANYGDQDVENTRITLRFEGQQKPLGTTRLEAGQSLVDTVVVQPTAGGWQSLELSLNDHPIQFDDAYHLAFEARDRVSVMLISDETADPYLRAAFADPAFFTLKTENTGRLNYSSMGEYDMVILQSMGSLSSGLQKALNDYIRNGGNVLVFPSGKSELATLNSSLKSLGADAVSAVQDGNFEVARINEASFVFQNVYRRVTGKIRLPSSRQRLLFEGGSRSRAEWLLRYADGRPYLQRFPAGDGNLFVSSAVLDAETNDLVRQAEVFVPMLFRMAVSSGTRRQSSYLIGRDESISLNVTAPKADESMRIEAEQAFIPAFTPRPGGIKLYTGDHISRSGVYPLTKGDSTLALLAYNYDRRESGQQFYTTAELKNMAPQASLWEDYALGSFGAEIRDMDRGIILWKWFVLLALFFLALEMLILRLWKQ